MPTTNDVTYAHDAFSDGHVILAYGERGGRIPLSDGGYLVVKVLDDMDTTPTDYEGAIEWDRGNRRPKSFNGAAVKIDTRNGPAWYQPPAGLTQEEHADHIRRIAAYYLEQWGYVGVSVTRHSPPIVGPFGGTMTDTVGASVWGIESDARDYIAEVARDLADGLLYRITETGGEG